MAATQLPRIPFVIQPSPVRLLYAEDLVAAKPYRDEAGVMGAPRFGCQFLIPADHPQAAELGRLLADLAAQTFPGRQAKFPTRKGDDINAQRVASGKKPYDCYAGVYVLYGKSNERAQDGRLLQPPRLVVLQGGKMVDYTDAQRPLAAPFFYSGVKACAAVTFQAYSGFGGGITCYVERVMSFNDGERISVGRSNEDVFGSVDSYSEYVGQMSAQSVVPAASPVATPAAPPQASPW